MIVYVCGVCVCACVCVCVCVCMYVGVYHVVWLPTKKLKFCVVCV